MVWIDSTSFDISADNALFGEQLKAWLATKNVREPYGAIIIAMVEDGFDLVGLTPKPLSGNELQEYILLIANKIREAGHVIER